MAGLTATGWESLRQVDIEATLQEAFRLRFGQDLNVSTTDPDSLPGQIIAVVAERLVLLWELAQGLYDSFVRQNASGVALDNLAGLIGLTRDPATPTTATVTLTATGPCTVPAGSLVATESGIEFSTDEEVVFGGAGTDTVTVTATETGAQVALAATIIVVSTPVVNWSAVNNVAAAATGQNDETDVALRDRMVRASSVASSSTVDGLVARLEDLDDVESAQVIENDTDATVDGRPPHSFEAIVYPDFGDDDAVAQVIWDNKPAGIATYGLIGPITVVDAQGNEHGVNFSYPTPVYFEVNVTITKNSDWPAVDGPIQVDERVMAWLNGATGAETTPLTYVALQPGADLKTYDLINALTQITGVDDIVVTTSVKGEASFSVTTKYLDPDEVARIQVADDVDLTVLP